MKVVCAIADMSSLAESLRREGRRIGLVPTMGALHEGHLSLVRLARTEADVTVVSSFVNPIQFGPAEDFSRYPRDDARDERLCEAEGVDIVFRPPAAEVYPPDFSVYVEETKLSRGLCGPLRPGHFRGVTTVVAKLFNIVRPHAAVFGRKDAQQARIIEQMVRDLDWPIRVIVAPIVRDPDGLAMSSRNVYLSADERKRATAIRRSLLLAERLWGEGVADTGVIRERMRRCLEAEAAPVSVEYIDTVDWETLEPVGVIGGPTLVAVAVRIGRTRLIDNTVLAAQ